MRKMLSLMFLLFFGLTICPDPKSSKYWEDWCKRTCEARAKFIRHTNKKEGDAYELYCPEACRRCVARNIKKNEDDNMIELFCYRTFKPVDANS
jgi:hypothetical protein